MYFDDRDFQQKIRFQKILWNMGYWTRIEIPIVIYENDRNINSLQKHFLTDIDVYGEKVQADFSTVKSIGDCKSGNNVKIFERIFWVRGVKEYLHAQYAYLIKKTITSKAKLFMPKVQVNGIDNESLVEFEKIYHSLELELFSEEYYRKRLDIILALRNEYKKIFNYMTTRYWFTNQNVSLRVLMTMLGKNDFYKMFNEGTKIHRFLILEICIMLSRNIMECCNYVLSRDLINVGNSVIEYIQGGIDEYNNRVQMIKEINFQIKEIFGDSKMSNNITVQPAYYEELLKIVVILIGEANNAKDVIRYLEIMQHEIVLERKFEYEKITGITYSAVGHKLAKDILVFYLKYNHIDKSIFNDILNE